MERVACEQPLTPLPSWSKPSIRGGRLCSMAQGQYMRITMRLPPPTRYLTIWLIGPCVSGIDRCSFVGGLINIWVKMVTSQWMCAFFGWLWRQRRDLDHEPTNDVVAEPLAQGLAAVTDCAVGSSWLCFKSDGTCSEPKMGRPSTPLYLTIVCV